MIFAVELPAAGLFENLGEILQSKPFAVVAVEALDKQGNAFDPAQRGELGLGDLVLAKNFAAKLEREILVLDERRKIGAVELGDVGRRFANIDARLESRFATVGEKLFLDARERASRDRRCFLDDIGPFWRRQMGAVARKDSDSANTIGAIIQEQAEIVLVGGTAGVRLTSPEPALRPEMLEEGDEAATPVMVANLDGQRTGDALAPALVVREAGIAAELAELAGGLALVRNDGGAVGDAVFRSMFGHG